MLHSVTHSVTHKHTLPHTQQNNQYTLRWKIRLVLLIISHLVPCRSAQQQTVLGNNRNMFSLWNVETLHFQRVQTQGICQTLFVCGGFFLLDNISITNLKKWISKAVWKYSKEKRRKRREADRLQGEGEERCWRRRRRRWQRFRAIFPSSLR